jgi:Flp pilus assembly protein TadG
MGRPLHASSLRPARRGAMLVYATAGMLVLIALSVLVVDTGRVMVAKSQLQDAADSAARYAAAGVVNSSTPETTARQHALAALSDFRIDGAAVQPGEMTLTIGQWNASTRQFVATQTSPNSVKVDLAISVGENGRPQLFSQNLGVTQHTVVRSSAIAAATVGSATFQPPAAGNLWLATAGAGTVNRNFRDDAPHVWDYAGNGVTTLQSPLELSLADLNLGGGDALSFEGLSGSAIYVANGGQNSADGVSNFIVAVGQTYPGTVPTNNLNGLSNTRAPIGAIMAVFLNNAPSHAAQSPTNLDFNNASQRDYASISPELRQVFFVGDGKRANGEVQKIIVPQGATRVFIGMMDAWQWNDNVGNFKFNVYGRKSVVTVR